LDNKIEEFRERNREYGVERFKEEYPEIVKELGGIDNVNYSELNDAGYGSEAEELDEFMRDDDDTVMMKVEAFYYTPFNDKGEDGKHTIQLSGVVNLEAPYHRSGNLEDYIEERFTFDTLKELEDKLDKGLSKVVSWFEGDVYDKNPRELKIRRMEAGGTLPTPFGQAGLVGETGAMNEMELFAMGGGLPQGVHQYYANTYNPAYPTPHGYAKGGRLGIKKFKSKKFKTKEEAEKSMNNLKNSSMYDKDGKKIILRGIRIEKEQDGYIATASYLKKDYRLAKGGEIDAFIMKFVKDAPASNLRVDSQELTAKLKKGGKLGRSKHSLMQDRRRVSSESWEVAYQKRKAKMEKGGEVNYQDIRSRMIDEVGFDRALSIIQREDDVVDPETLIISAVRLGKLSKEEVNRALINSAESESDSLNDSYKDSGFGFGSSDMSASVKSILRDAGYQDRIDTKSKMEAGGTLPTPFGQAGLVGETGAMNEIELFAMGGGLPQGVHQYYAQTYNPSYPTPHGYAKGGMTDVERQSMIDMGYSEEQIKEVEDNPRRGGRFAKGGSIMSNRDAMEDFINSFSKAESDKIEKSAKYYSVTPITVISTLRKYYKVNRYDDGSVKQIRIDLFDEPSETQFKFSKKYSKGEKFAKGGETEVRYTEDELKYALGVDDDYENWVELAFQSGYKYDESKDEWYLPDDYAKGGEVILNKRQKETLIRLKNDLKESQKYLESIPKSIDDEEQLSEEYSGNIYTSGFNTKDQLKDIIQQLKDDINNLENNTMAKGGKVRSKKVLQSIIDEVEKEGKRPSTAYYNAKAELDSPKMAKGGKTQGYNSRLDESLGNRKGKESTKQQSKKDRRDESKGMEKGSGRRAYSSVSTMDVGDRMMAKGGDIDFSDKKNYRNTSGKPNWDKISENDLKKGYKKLDNDFRDRVSYKEFKEIFIEQNVEVYAKGGNVPKRFLDEKGERKNDPETIKELTKYVMSLPQTKKSHYNNTTEKYSPKRQKLHREIINKFKGDLVCIESDEPIAILMGGSPASGKSTFLKKYAPYLLKEELLRIDADEVRAMLPEYKGWNASATHNETQDIVKTLLSDRTIGVPCKYDLIFDGTMTSPKKYLDLIKLLKKIGYKVFVVFIDKVPKDVIMKRAMDRYKKSGRFVPPFVIEEFFESGKDSLAKVKSKVDGYMIVDGSDSNYKISEQKGLKLPKTRKYGRLGVPLKKSIKRKK
jgi:predicted ABC-type ATPase